jgi:hypothetical protein
VVDLAGALVVDAAVAAGLVEVVVFFCCAQAGAVPITSARRRAANVLLRVTVASNLRGVGL